MLSSMKKLQSFNVGIVGNMWYLFLFWLGSKERYILDSGERCEKCVWRESASKDWLCGVGPVGLQEIRREA